MSVNYPDNKEESKIEEHLTEVSQMNEEVRNSIGTMEKSDLRILKSELMKDVFLRQWLYMQALMRTNLIQYV